MNPRLREHRYMNGVENVYCGKCNKFVPKGGFNKKEDKKTKRYIYMLGLFAKMIRDCYKKKNTTGESIINKIKKNIIIIMEFATNLVDVHQCTRGSTPS